MNKLNVALRKLLVSHMGPAARPPLHGIYGARVGNMCTISTTDGVVVVRVRCHVAILSCPPSSEEMHIMGDDAVAGTWEWRPGDGGLAQYHRQIAEPPITGALWVDPARLSRLCTSLAQVWRSVDRSTPCVVLEPSSDESSPAYFSMAVCDIRIDGCIMPVRRRVL